MTAFEPGALAARISAASRRPASTPAAGVISLAMGEPSEGTPAAVVEAAVGALRHGRTRYAALTGLPALRQAIAAHETARHARVVAPGEVVCTHGASAGLAAAVLAVVGPDDRVVVPEPTYSLYADHVAMAGGTVDWVANRPDGTVDVDAVIGALGGARMVVLCSPGNPTGVVVEPDELARLAAAANDAGAFLLCDEAYADIVFDGRRAASVLDLEPGAHLICARTFSKAYAMTGWRLGYVVAAAPIADAVNLVHRTVNGALSTFTQDAGLAALQVPHADLDALARTYEERRDLVMSRLASVPRHQRHAATGRVLRVRPLRRRTLVGRARRAHRRGRRANARRQRVRAVGRASVPDLVRCVDRRPDRGTG